MLLHRVCLKRLKYTREGKDGQDHPQMFVIAPAKKGK
jgi:hypothetical protein